jgi:hypothetical protein
MALCEGKSVSAIHDSCYRLPETDMAAICLQVLQELLVRPACSMIACDFSLGHVSISCADKYPGEFNFLWRIKARHLLGQIDFQRNWGWSTSSPFVKSQTQKEISKTPRSFTLQVQQDIITAYQQYLENRNILLCPLPFHAVGTSGRKSKLMGVRFVTESLRVMLDMEHGWQLRWH